MISFFEKAHLNSSVRLLLELHCIIVIKHVTFFTIRCEITSNSGIHIYLSDLIKNIGGLTDWAKKRHGSADLHTLIHPPHRMTVNEGDFNARQFYSSKGDPLGLRLRLSDGAPTAYDVHTRDRLDIRTVINREKR